MEERGLRAIQLKTYVPKTSDGRADKPSSQTPSSKLWARAPSRRDSSSAATVAANMAAARTGK